jgi:hypothetical protein
MPDSRGAGRNGLVRLARMRWTVGVGACGASQVDPRGTGTVTVVAEPRSIAMTTSTETGNVTGTKDKDYDLIWFTEACLDNALRLETYIQDAEREGDSDLMDLFRRAQSDSRKGAEQAKKLLARRLSG